MMKSKKGAFANSATNHTKRHHTNNNSHKAANRTTAKSGETSLSNNNNNTSSSKRKTKNFGLEDDTPKPDDDNDLNSGFGDYLRSNEGVEMMKIFVFANTVMVIITMAWPHMQQQYIWFLEWLDSFKQE